MIISKLVRRDLIVFIFIIPFCKSHWGLWNDSFQSPAEICMLMKTVRASEVAELIKIRYNTSGFG